MIAPPKSSMLNDSLNPGGTYQYNKKTVPMLSIKTSANLTNISNRLNSSRISTRYELDKGKTDIAPMTTREKDGKSSKEISY